MGVRTRKKKKVETLRRLIGEASKKKQEGRAQAAKETTTAALILKKTTKKMKKLSVMISFNSSLMKGVKTRKERLDETEPSDYAEEKKNRSSRGRSREKKSRSAWRDPSGTRRDAKKQGKGSEEGSDIRLRKGFEGMGRVMATFQKFASGSTKPRGVGMGASVLGHT